MTDLPSQCDAKILSMTSLNMLVRLVEEVRWFVALPSGGTARYLSGKESAYIAVKSN